MYQFLKYSFENAYVSSGNFGFKLSRERNLRKNGRGIFVVRTLKFVKVCCHTCSYITLIPTYGRFKVPEPVHCEGCGKAVLEKNPFLK